MHTSTKLKSILTTVTVWFATVPLTISAQIGGTSTTSSSGCSSSACAGNSLADLMQYLLSIMTRYLVPIIFSIAIIAFFWGIIQYVINAENEAKRKEGRDYILWGFGALFVMVAIWGIIALISNTLGIGVGGTLGVPQFGQ
jgi:hypothetical protein